MTKPATITLPRSLVERLVDPEDRPYWYDDVPSCRFCGGMIAQGLGFQDNTHHTSDCPIWLVQEALAKEA